MAQSSLLSLFQPVRTLEERGGVSLYIHMPKALFWTASVTALILALDVVWVCSAHMDCGSALPTLSYMSSFRPNDRFATLAVCMYSLALPGFYLLMHASISDCGNIWDLRVMHLAALTLCLSVPFVQIFDEANLTHFGPTEKMHLVFMVGVTSLGAIWTYLYLISLYQKPKSVLRSGSRQVSYILSYLLVTALASLCAFWQWFSVKTEDWTTHYLEPGSEYVAVALGLYLPAVMSLLTTRVEIQISTLPSDRVIVPQ